MFYTDAELQKALDSTSSSGLALIPEKIDPYIAELALKKSPLRTLIPRRSWKSRTYDRILRSAFGRARFTGDGMSVSETNSTYSRFQEVMKILSARGSVSGYLQDASDEVVDAYRNEVKGHTVAAAQEEELVTIYGNAKADEMHFNGLDTWIATNNTNVNAVPTDFSQLDSAINSVAKQTGGQLPAFIMLSMDLKSKLERLMFTTQRYVDKVKINGGAELLTYRGVPLYDTSFINENVAWTGSTVTAAKQAGGALADNTYYYKVSAITINGETLPCTEVNATTETTNNSVKLTWTAPAMSGSVYAYKIFRSTTTNTETLLTVIPGVAYQKQSDILGTVLFNDVVSFLDTGASGSMTVTYATGAVSGYNFVTAGTKSSEVPLVANGSDIYVVSTEVPNVEGGDATAMMTLRNLSLKPLAPIMDKEWFLIVAYEALIMVEQFSAKLRNVKLA